MAQIVLYDKQARDNPIVSIQPAARETRKASLQDSFPGADANRYGVVIVPDDVIERMTAHEYKTDRKGKVALQPVLQQKTKAVLSASDSALGQNIVSFGEPYAEIGAVTDAKDQPVQATALDPKKGLVGLGKSSGFFSVTCAVATGAEAPEIVSHEKNWEWVRDAGGAISGMKILK